jgi:glycerophosphoryl diester phosphodiesterase
MQTSNTALFWPYPRYIAHRGAGLLAPENTLAAFQLGAAHGHRMFECDVKLSADGQAFLLHDDTLERTSNGAGVAGHQAWANLRKLDAGSWHSPAFAGEPLPTLQAVAAYCLSHGFALNLEIKPTEGSDALAQHTGTVVAAQVAALWQGQEAVPPPLLSSFKPAALAGAQASAAHLPRALLLDTLWDGWLATARRLGCVAVVCNDRLWTADVVAQVKAAQMRTLSYTVNDEASARALFALGTDGIITDRVDLFLP